MPGIRRLPVAFRSRGGCVPRPRRGVPDGQLRTRRTRRATTRGGNRNADPDRRGWPGRRCTRAHRGRRASRHRSGALATPASRGGEWRCRRSAGCGPVRRRSPVNGGARDDLRAGLRGTAGVRVLREGHRADAGQQLRDLPSRRRHRAVGDDGLRHGPRLRTDDPRGGPHQAHAALARRPGPRRFRQRPVAVDRRGPQARALGRGRRAPWRRPRPPGYPRRRVAGLGAGRTGSHRRHPGVRRAGNRRGRVPVPARRESARPRRLGARHGDPARRPRRAAPRHHDIPQLQRRRHRFRSARRRLGRLRAGGRNTRRAREHRYVPAGGRADHLPDALHALRQGGDGSIQARALFPRHATEAPPRQRRADEYAHPDSAQHQVAQRVRGTHVRARCPALQPAAARPLPRHGIGVPRLLPGWPRGVAVVGAELRFQLADDLRARRAQGAAGRHPRRPYDVVGQLGAEPRQPGSEPRSALGPAVVGRDAVRQPALS